MIWQTLAVSLFFTAVHLLAGRMRFLTLVPRPWWLSFAGGVSVAYVFLHLLPEANTHSDHLEEHGLLSGTWLERSEPVFLVALLGVSAFYGLERWVMKRRNVRTRKEDPSDSDTETTPRGVFWLHVGSFAFYNLLISYLMVHEGEWETASLVAFALALGVHFVVNDFALHEHHARLYRRRGRWILAAASPVGWLLGVLVPTHVALNAALFGFVCGAITLNALKEELPAERKSKFTAFFAGVVCFGGLLLLI